MASGNTLLTLLPQQAVPAASNYATLDLRNSTHVVLDFDASTPESVYFDDILPMAYAGGGITCTIAFMMTSATSGSVVLGIKLERHQDEVDDLDSDSFASELTVTATAPSTAGAVQYANISFTDGAQMDSIAAGEHFRLAFRRVADSGSDDATGDCELLGIHIKES